MSADNLEVFGGHRSHSQAVGSASLSVPSSASSLEVDFQEFYRSFSERFMLRAQRDTHVIFVRHGETEWNLAKKYQGSQDSALTEAGVEGALNVGKRLSAMHAQSSEHLDGSRKLRIAAVFSSPLGRAKRTAQIAVSQFSVEHRAEIGPIFYDRRLQERNLGDWEGRSKAEVTESFDNEMNIFSGPLIVQKIPGEFGESVGDVRSRMTAFLEEIAKCYKGQTVLVFSHRGAISSIITKILLGPFGEENHFRGFFVNNCTINVLVRVQTEDKWYVSRLGDNDFALLKAESGKGNAVMDAMTSLSAFESSHWLCVAAGFSLCLAMHLLPKHWTSQTDKS